jgi:hypothetical protein
MDLTKVRAVLQTYEQLLQTTLVPVERWEKPSPPDLRGQLAHARWMCSEALANPEFSEGKSKRWLGFVQGVLWATGTRTVEQMKNDNRPTE